MSSNTTTKALLRLHLLHAAAVILPVLVHPWLARQLEPEAYGRIVFVTAAITYFALFCDFGFNWSATRLIAAHRGDAKRCSEIVSATMLAKALLFTFGFVLLLGLMAWVSEFGREGTLLVVAYVGVFGTVISPAHYFQGIEKAHLSLGIDVIARLGVVVAVVLFVREPGDALLAISVLAAGQLVAGSLGLALLAQQRSHTWIWPSMHDVRRMLKSGVPLFLSASAISLYTATGSLLLGFVSTREQVAYFGAAQKVVTAASTFFQPFHFYFYPRITRERLQSPKEAVRLVFLALRLQLAFGLVLSATMLVFADEIAVLLFGTAFASVAACLRWMAVVPLLLSTATVFANFVMLPAGRDRLHLAMTLVAGLINVAVLLSVGAAKGSIGAAVGIVLSEAFVLAFSVVVGMRILSSLKDRGGQ